MKEKITPFLWFDSNAEEAAKFYTKVFKKSKVRYVSRYDEAGSIAANRPVGSAMVVAFTLEGQNFDAINGGPIFKPNPSISFFVNCNTAKEVDIYYNKLSTGGKVMMELAQYPFSKRYAFIEDKYGVSWQIILNDKKSKQKIVPSLLFVGASLGKAQAAVKLYTKVFKKSKINSLQLYKEEQFGNKPGTVMHSLFTLNGQQFVAMDGAGPHQFAFNEAISFIIDCKDQKEVDYYWKSLIANGGAESQCGWLKDPFGVSWQVTPRALTKFMSNKKTAKKAMEAMLKMKKIDIKKIEDAVKGK